MQRLEKGFHATLARVEDTVTSWVLRPTKEKLSIVEGTINKFYPEFRDSGIAIQHIHRFNRFSTPTTVINATGLHYAPLVAERIYHDLDNLFKRVDPTGQNPEGTLPSTYSIDGKMRLLVPTVNALQKCTTILLPPNAPKPLVMEKWKGRKLSSSFTVFSGDEVFSFVSTLAEGFEKKFPLRYTSMDNFATEVCHQIVSVSPLDPFDYELNAVIDEREESIGQEIFGNSIGCLVAYRSIGVRYAEYKQIMENVISGKDGILGGEYHFIAFPESLYNSMPILKPLLR